MSPAPLPPPTPVPAQSAAPPPTVAPSASAGNAVAPAPPPPVYPLVAGPPVHAQRAWQQPLAPPPPPPPPEFRARSGFYARLGLGLGSISAASSQAIHGDEALALVAGRRKYTTGAGNIHLALGWGVGEGLVVAAMFSALGGAEIESTVDDGRPPDQTEVDDGWSMAVSSVGPVVDWYPSDDSGWHLGGGASFASFVLRTPKQEGTEDGVLKSDGYSLTALGGYDFSLSDQWALGGFLTVSRAWTSGEQDVQHWGDDSLRQYLNAGEARLASDEGILSVAASLAVLWF